MNDQGRESPSPTRLAAWKTPEVRAGACPHPAPPPGGGDRTRRGAGAEPRAPGAGGGGARRLGRASARHLLRLRSRWLSASRLPLAARLGKGSGINEAGGGPGRRWGRGGLRETPPPPHRDLGAARRVGTFMETISVGELGSRAGEDRPAPVLGGSLTCKMARAAPCRLGARLRRGEPCASRRPGASTMVGVGEGLGRGACEGLSGAPEPWDGLVADSPGERWKTLVFKVNEILRSAGTGTGIFNDSVFSAAGKCVVNREGIAM